MRLWLAGMAGALALAGSGAQAAPAGKVEDQIEQANRLAESDPAAALALMKQAAASGDAEALNGLGVFTQMGVGMPADPEAGHRLMEQAAAKGSKAAALNLGRHFLADDDPDNDARGVALLKPLAEDAQLAGMTLYPLGRAMLFGQGGPRFLDGGVELLLMAEEQEPDNADLLYLIARSHQQGWGKLDPDSTKAAQYFRRSGDAGDGRAQWYYGMALLRGEGVGRDERLAWAWVRRSAEEGYVDGQISAAVMLATGQGVAEDDPTAREWYRKASEQGSAHALRGYGSMLLTGEGGPTDLVRGYAYIEMAAEGGDKNAGRILQQMPPRLSMEERREAEDIKVEWKRKFGDPR